MKLFYVFLLLCALLAGTNTRAQVLSTTIATDEDHVLQGTSTNFFVANPSWLRAAIEVPTMAALRAYDISGLANGEGIRLLGYYTPGDGGGGDYVVTNTVAGTNAYGGRIVVLGGTRSLQLIDDGKITTRQFGVFPSTDGSATLPLDALFSYCASNLKTAVIGSGAHYLTNTCYLRSNLTIDAEPNGDVVRNWVSAIDTRYAMFSVLGDLWPNNYLDTNVTTFTIVATNITVKNVGLRAASTNMVGFPLAISNAKYVTVDGVRIGMQGYAWGITILADDVSIRNCTINNMTGDSESTIYTDGIHCIGGNRIRIENNNIRSGDDCIALSAIGTIGFSDVGIYNNTVYSHRAHALRMQQDRPYSYAVWTNVVVDGIVGSAGLVSNGGILIQNESTNGFYFPFRGIALNNIKLQVGNLSTQGGGTNFSGGNRGVFIEYANGLKIKNVSVTRTAFESFDFEYCLDVDAAGLFGDGAEWSFRNASMRIDNCTNVVVRDSYLNTRTTSIVTTSSPMTVIASDNVKITGNVLYGVNINKGGIVFETTQSGHITLQDNLFINSSGYGILSVINPVSLLVSNNKVTAATAASWQGGSPPVLGGFGPNVGISSLGRSSGLGYDVLNSSSGNYIGSFDVRGNYEGRWMNTNGMFFLAQDAANGGNKVARFGFQPSSSAGKPIIIASGNDPGSFPVLNIGYGSSLMDGPRWVNFGAASSDYTAGTYVGTWNNNGMKIEPGGSPGSPTADSIFDLVSTTKGGRSAPSMTAAQRGAIAPSSGGLEVFDTTALSPYVSAGNTTNWWRPILPMISADRGDVDVTLTSRDAVTQRFATTLTANRTVTLPSGSIRSGDIFWIVRTGLGAFTLDVGGLKTIPSATAATVIVQYDGTAWRLVGYMLL